MNKCSYFGRNLSEIRKARKLSVSELSSELDIPKSTLQSILNDGSTTLYTAIQISNRLDIPLSSLTNESYSGKQTDMLSVILKCFECYTRLPAEDQEKIAYHTKSILNSI